MAKKHGYRRWGSRGRGSSRSDRLFVLMLIAQGRKSMRKKIGDLKLPVVAKELIERYNLNGTSSGRSLLRHELQRGLLKCFEDKIVTQEPLWLLERITSIECALWQRVSNIMPTREALELHNSALGIAKRMLLAAKNKTNAKNWQETIEELKGKIIGFESELRQDPESEAEINPTVLLSIAKQGAELAEQKATGRAFFLGHGFSVIDRTAENAFRRQKQ